MTDLTIGEELRGLKGWVEVEVEGSGWGMMELEVPGRGMEGVDSLRRFEGGSAEAHADYQLNHYG